MAHLRASSDCELTRNYSRTAYRKTSFLHTWAIEDFSIHQDALKTGGFMESPKFGPPGDGKSRWSLKMITSIHRGYSNPVTFYLVSHATATVRARFQSWIVDANGAKFEPTVPSARDFQGTADANSQKLQEVSLWGNCSDNTVLPGDTLTFCVQMTVLEISNSSEVSVAYEPLPGPCLEDDFGRLFKSKRFTDVVLVAGGKTFHAHKAILGARSSVFDAMFQNTMTEYTENRVEIEDLRAEVVEDMLTFMYTNNAPNMDVLAQDLLRAADKYDLKRLKAMCVGQLLSNITVETAVDVFALGNLHDSADLKACAVDFIAEHASDVMKTDGWKRMVRESPAIVESVCYALFEAACSRLRVQEVRVQTCRADRYLSNVLSE